MVARKPLALVPPPEAASSDAPRPTSAELAAVVMPSADTPANVSAQPLAGTPAILDGLSFNLNQKPRKKSQQNIINEINQSLPVGIELYRTHRFHLGGDFVVLKVKVPPQLEPKLKEWRESLRQKYPNTLVTFRRVTVDRDILKHLRSHFRSTDLLTKDAQANLQEMIKKICGKEPLASTKPRRNPPERENLQAVPFIAIDRPEVLNREDLIHGERKHDGTLVLKVAIIDISDYIRPGSEQYKYALRVGSDWFGRHRVISTIGTSLAHGPASFCLGEARPAWVVELRIDPTKGVDAASFKLKRATVKNHCNLNPDQPFDARAQPEIARTIGALAEITRILEHHRMSRSPIIAIDGEGTAARIVSEIMIETYERLAIHMSDTLGIPAGYVVHTEPSKEDRRSWEATLQELKMPFPASLTDGSGGIRDLLLKLEDQDSPVARELENTILDEALLRSVMSTSNRGHWALRVKGYTRFKPRDALGIINQLSLDAAMTDTSLEESKAKTPKAVANQKDGPAITREEIKMRIRSLNNKRWTRDEKLYKLRFLEMLEEKLGKVGELFFGTVAKVEDYEPTLKYPMSTRRQDNGVAAGPPFLADLRSSRAQEKPALAQGPVYLQVKDFTKWGVVPIAESMNLKVGDIVAVRLVGFNLTTMRFEFELTMPPLPQGL